MIEKKVLFSITVALTILAMIGGATIIQLLPLTALGIILALEIWDKQKLQVLGLSLSILMFIVNMAAVSVFDIVFWVSAITIYSLERLN